MPGHANETINRQSLKQGPNKQSQISAEVLPSKKYLIYLCDRKVYCYGLGDRQRAIVGVYMLAILTNRTFGIIMTSPSDFTEFYQPNLVHWNIPATELVGKSSTEIDELGSKKTLRLDKIDFNAEYPHDVVYMRTNQKVYLEAAENPLYAGKFPAWSRVPLWRLFQVAWLRLVTPTELLRQELNAVLTEIAQNMQDEYDVWQRLRYTGCCLTTVLCSGDKCLTNDGIQSSRKRCTDSLKTQSTGESYLKSSRLPSYIDNVCSATFPVLKPSVNIHAIQKLTGFDVVNLNIVCIHIRLGRSKTFPFETVSRNKEGLESAVWRFIQPYLDKGHHVYLATDSEEVREKGKALFGHRLHVNNESIVHIALVQNGQDPRAGFRSALTEQLLLTTSCKVLMVSYSGFSMKAAQLRQELQGYDQSLFMYQNGSVFGKSVHWLP